MTDREQQILAYMQQQIKKNGYPPTVREICAALNIKSTSTVHKAIGSLQEQGFIRKDPVKRRALEVINTETGEGPVRKEAEAPAPESSREDVVDIPVVGRIAAGTPILAEQNIEDSFPLPSRYLGKGTNFMLTVHGESMIEAGIMDGDYILVEQQNTAANGDIVVAMIDGLESEATVKTYYKENGHYRLQPQNSSMDPIIVDKVQILGLVKGVFRYFH
ncbi:MAG: transcriptional repressor LexA [Firmicutes bacterium]|nr:transcriptional repressor LexA [Bacillota bacterium]MBQ1887348.1 transcriptional repressor LexA [Bacillota bacterium]MBQ2456344.1 transcriptional repressor LexA [Bacillota bacterium]MBQ3577379.1 transcriptional repressor LexA [Bacillota bacterium]MBQ5437579.1 transcriptional repressor LexA [Bacillota bacterium]